MAAAGRGEREATSPTPKGTRRCPICGKPAAARFRPFCSRRCADIDLHRWLSNAYAIPSVEDAAPAGEVETSNDQD
jgi:endogenous inhibitor of DNA gyrase (YacG/DUF329 family)